MVETSTLREEHRATMEANGVDIASMIEWRRDCHQHAEIAFNEVRTQASIVKLLTQWGIKDSEITPCAGTGLVVRVSGTGAPVSDSGVKSVAIRADMDALPMEEHNKDLPWKTTTAYAHMCGHDGHMAMLLAAAQLFAMNRSKIPSNKEVRLLFQPAEEGPGGAEPMVKAGCLSGVDEVYGLHNVPNFTAGEVRVCNGGIFSEVTLVKIKVKGHGGHGSAPHKTRDPINAAAHILTGFNAIKARSISSKENWTFTICNVKSGSTYNVMPSECFMQGTLRTYNVDARVIACKKIRAIAELTAQAHDCEAEVDLNTLYPATVNHDEQVEIVRRVADRGFGGASQEDLPMTASEDFSYFLLEKPGAFFCLGTKRKEDETLHSSTYDFNDTCLATGALFWVKLVEDRLAVSLLK